MVLGRVFSLSFKGGVWSYIYIWFKRGLVLFILFYRICEGFIVEGSVRKYVFRNLEYYVL